MTSRAIRTTVMFLMVIVAMTSIASAQSRNIGLSQPGVRQSPPGGLSGPDPWPPGRAHSPKPSILDVRGDNNAAPVDASPQSRPGNTPAVQGPASVRDSIVRLWEDFLSLVRSLYGTRQDHVREAGGS